LLLEAAPRVMRAVRMAIASLDDPALTIPQFRTLHFVHEHADVNLSATAEFVGLTLPSTSKLVDQLVRRGMLARDDASDDRRRMNLRITDEGNALLKSAQESVKRHLAGMLGRFGSQELESLHATLELLRGSFPAQSGAVAAQSAAGGNDKEIFMRDPRANAKTSARTAAS
jgi:DNA-binding MarR family transcriptional regulator